MICKPVVKLVLNCRQYFCNLAHVIFKIFIVYLLYFQDLNCLLWRYALYLQFEPLAIPTTYDLIWFDLIWEVGLCMVVIKIFSMIHNIFLVLCKPFFLTFQYEHINILSDGNDRHHIVYILCYTLRIICQHIKWQVYNNRFYAEICLHISDILSA